LKEKIRGLVQQPVEQQIALHVSILFHPLMLVSQDLQIANDEGQHIPLHKSMSPLFIVIQTFGSKNKTQYLSDITLEIFKKCLVPLVVATI
jgi:hypothetical protein